MTRKEAERQTRQMDTLMSLGFTRDEVEQLRRISMTLRRWFELECGDSNEYVSWAIERDGDEPDSPPYLVQHVYLSGNAALHTGATTTRTRIADRETGARKRLTKILDARNARITNDSSPDAERNIHATCSAKLTGVVSIYIQTDPRGAALYILRPGDVPEGGNPSAYYNRGVCVY